MFQFSKRKKRLLHKYQYEVLWKQAQQKLTTNLYARYATLVSMFRAFDEDKDGRITFDEFEGRLKKMWDPAHYKGWEARVLFNSGMYGRVRLSCCTVGASPRVGWQSRNREPPRSRFQRCRGCLSRVPKHW